MFSCPICEYHVDDSANLCPQCGWEFQFFFGMTEEDEAIYRQQVLQAQQAWQQRQKNTAAAITPPTAETTPAESPTNSFVAEPSPPPSNVFTPPDLDKAEQESWEQFAQRIENGNPYLAGMATLLTERYQAKTETLPLKVDWLSWLPSNLAQGLYVKIPAAQMAELSINQSVKVHLTVEQGDIVITGFALHTPKATLGIKQEEDEQFWQWAKQQNSVECYQQYLQGQTLKNHHKAARENLAVVQKQKDKQELLIFLGVLVIVMISTMSGALGIGTLLKTETTLQLALLGGLGSATVCLFVLFLIFKWVRYLHFLGDATLCVVESVNGRKLIAAHTVIDRQKETKVTIRGWAIDKPYQQAAGNVFICLNRKSAILALYGKERPDIVRSLGNEHYRKCGFAATFDTRLLQSGENIIKFKVLTADKRGYYLPEQTLKLFVI